MEPKKISKLNKMLLVTPLCSWERRCQVGEELSLPCIVLRWKPRMTQWTCAADSFTANHAFPHGHTRTPASAPLPLTLPLTQAVQEPTHEDAPAAARGRETAEWQPWILTG